jgi:predicted O-linked N-acetylglucosamine transferase (SPINDLY family)
VDALVHAGQLLTRMRRPTEALELLERGLTLDACYPYAAWSLFDAAAAVCHWPLRERAAQAAVAGVHAGRRASVPFTFVGISDSPADQLACARVWVQQQIPPLARQAGARLEGRTAAGGTQSATARTRIAYLSPDLRDHPVGRLVAPLFESHDRSGFEITAVQFGPRVQDVVRARIERAVDQVLDVSDLSDRDAAAAIRASGAAVAVDLAGYTRHARTGILAHRAAPVQVSWLGYPGTLGADFIDYLIADASVLPDEHRSFYTESIVRLPHSVLAAERHAIAPPPTRAACALPRDAFVFCNVGSCYKLAPQIFEIWMRMLLKAPQAVLWLSEPAADAVASLKAAASSCGVAPERLVFAPRLPATGQYLARLQLADLFLDTLPYGSHSTAADALWAGVPLLTCEGATFAGRLGASLLRNVALPELITTSLAQYESLGVALAADPVRLKLLRQRLGLNRRTAPLFDPGRLARDLERAYRLMWDRYRRGDAPATFDVPAT